MSMLVAAAQMGYNYGNGNTLRRLKRRVARTGSAIGGGASTGTSAGAGTSESLVSGAASRISSLLNNRYSQYVVGAVLRRKPQESAKMAEKTAGVPKMATYIDLLDSNSVYSDSNTLVNSVQQSSSSSASSVVFDDEFTIVERPAPKAVETATSAAEHGEPSLLGPEELKAFIKTFYHAKATEIGKHCHLHYYQLPFAWRENRFIINGYRFYNSHRKSLLSVFNWYGWHNETSNIWTHLIGGIYLMYLATMDFPNSEVYNSPLVPLPAKLIVYVFLLAGMKCLFASVFWHTFNGTSFLNLRSKFACVDYSGITLLITASIMTTEFVTMYDYKTSLFLYMSISAVLGVIGIFMNWSPKFDRPEARPLRIKFFILLAAMGFLCIFQLSMKTSWEFTANLVFPVSKKSLVWYLIGVFFYGSFIPERFRTDYVVDDSIPTELQLSSDISILTKRKHVHFRQVPTKHPISLCRACHAHSFRSLWWVDYFGSSHMIWHFFVVLGVVGHYHAILDMFVKRWIPPMSHL